MILITAVGFYDLVLGQFIPSLPIVTDIINSFAPVFSWRIYVFLLLVLALFAVLEGSYKLHKHTEGEIGKLETRIQVLEDERIPRITTKPFCAKRSFDYENKHLMWAELRVSNTSQSLPLKDVQVRIISQWEIINYFDRNTEIEKNDLYDRRTFSPISLVWSERDTNQPEITTIIAPNSTKAALIAYQDNSNGGSFILNAPTSPKPIIIGGAKIKIEVSSSNSATVVKDFYLECHGNILTIDGTIFSKFEFIEWDEWTITHDIKRLLSYGKEDSQI